MPLKDYDDLVSKDFRKNTKVDARTYRKILEERAKMARIPECIAAVQKIKEANETEIARQKVIEIENTKDNRRAWFREDERNKRRLPAPNLTMDSAHCLSRQFAEDAEAAAEKRLAKENIRIEEAIREGVFAKSNPAVEIQVERAESLREQADRFDEQKRKGEDRTKDRGDDRGRWDE